MHRTESDNLLVVGGLNKYTDGPPGTTVNAIDKNTIQEELAYLIETNGLILKTIVTETNQQVYDAIAVQIAASAAANSQKEVRTESKNLILSNLTVTTIDADADRLRLLNTSFVPAFIDNLDTTFNITTDLMAGTAEKASTWYQLWLDSAGTRLMVPDIAGSCDGTSAGFLVDSGNTFATDLVKAGDIVRDRTGLGQTTVSVTPTVDGANLAVTDDIFVNLDDYEIHLLSPTGLSTAFKANIGKVFNSAGSDLTKLLKNGAARITTSFWHTGNGYGVTNTNIPRFTTEIEASDDVVVTITNLAGAAADDGFRIIANMDCELSIGFSGPQTTTAGYVGFSKNSTQLSTNISAIDAADRTAINFQGSSAAPNYVSIEGIILKKGDFICPHTNGNTFSAATVLINIKAKEII